MTISSLNPRVLLVAYQCGPGMGSVSQIGWEWYRRLSERVHVTLVTHVRNRAALDLAGVPLGSSEVIFVDTEWFAGPLFKLAKRLFPRSEHAASMLSALDFFVFDHVALQMLRQRIANGKRWNLLHAVTPVTTLAATRLHRLGLPIIKGPLNCGVASPRGFRAILRDEYPWIYPLRNIGRLIDACLGSTRNSTVILTATRATVDRVPRRYRSRCIKMLENGVDLEVFTPAAWPSPPSPIEPLRVLFVGRLMPFKAVGLLLEAVARVVGEFPIEFSIIGDGPMGPIWRGEAQRLGLTEKVNFLGSRSLAEVAAAMRAAHVFCLPSVRESGGAVLLEAMACARPVLAVAFGGPAEIVDDTVGGAIAPDGVEQTTTALAEALRDIVRNPDNWRRRGENGYRRARELYSWNAKVEHAIQLYRDILSESPGHRVMNEISILPGASAVE
jgi:glycosyltransferase involved in cell wall biosynthesis